MGLCWSATLPKEDDDDSNSSQSPRCLANSSNTARKVIEFGKEELKLNELLASLRTGLVFAPTEFSVLPGGLSTTAKLSFEVGNSELQRRQEAAHLKEESLHDDVDKSFKDSEGDDMEGEEVNAHAGPYKLKMTLEGHGWVKKLVMTLRIEPVLGNFAGRTLLFHWRDDTLSILGSEQGELEAHSLPIAFESEVEFCISCLQLAYQSKKPLIHKAVDEDAQAAVGAGVQSLKYTAYKTTIANLDILAGRFHTIPARLYHVLFGPQDPIDISISLWPESNANGTTTTLKVKSGILFAELIYLVQEHLCCAPGKSLKLYSNFRPVNMGEVVSGEFKHLDCFAVTPDDLGPLSSSFLSLHEVPDSTSDELVLSLVGEKFQSMEVDLQMSMEKFDTLIRCEFNLREDSFLIILAEDDLSPQYVADDNWKCTYTFSIPDTSFGANIRRSFHRLSARRRGNEHPPANEANSSTFAPQMAEVTELLSSNERRFPRNGTRCGLSIGELYQAMPIYRMSLEQCGIGQFSITQVFEVTGPSIPITVRVSSDYSNNGLVLHTPNAPRNRLANIMDINPDWSVSTFLQYIDAVISPSSPSRQRKVWLKDNSVDYKTNLSKLTLGALLDSWKPLWWTGHGTARRHLATKDIDPSEFLVVEKL
jgi:hypothetical protein